jgi:hypothetical protein
LNMIRVWRLLPKTLLEKPFDVYSALSVLTMSLFSFFRGDFPESLDLGVPMWLWTIIDVYIIISAVIILGALFCNKTKHLGFSYFGQMWGWAFLSSASISLMTYLFYNGLITLNISLDPSYWIIGFIYGCIGWAAFFKSINMWFDLVEARKNNE